MSGVRLLAFLSVVAVAGCLRGARKCIVCRFGILAHPVTAPQLRDADKSWMSRGALLSAR